MTALPPWQPDLELDLVHALELDYFLIMLSIYEGSILPVTVNAPLFPGVDPQLSVNTGIVYMMCFIICKYKYACVLIKKKSIY